MSGDRLAVGLIGCGKIAVNYHVPAYLALAERCRVVAVADPTPSRRDLAAAELGLSGEALFVDALELLDSVPVDVVDVCTPQHLRKEIVLAALERGIHVLSEKPLASIPADAAELVDAARSSGVHLGIVHNYLFWPEVESTVRRVAAGDIGAVRVAIVNFLGVPDLPGVAAWQPRWRHDPSAAGGGVLMDMLHAVYVAEALLDTTFDGVSAFVTAHTPGSQVEEVALCRYEAARAAALVNVGWGHGPGGLTVVGDEGRIEVRYADGGTPPFAPLETVRVHTGRGSRTIEIPESPGGIPAAIGDFVDAVGRARPPRATGEDGVRALEATVAAYAAAARGRTVALPLDRGSPVFRRGVAGLGELVGHQGARPALRGLFGLDAG
jgi:predicted dehydrogenase